MNGWELATGQFPSSAATVFPVVAAGNIALDWPEIRDRSISDIALDDYT